MGNLGPIVIIVVGILFGGGFLVYGLMHLAWIFGS
jgi:hypothetical protein